MGLQNSLSERMEAVRIIINTAMARNDIKPEDIETRKIMHANTFYKKRKQADTFKFSEFWRLDDILHFTDEEILQLFGRRKK